MKKVKLFSFGGIALAILLAVIFVSAKPKTEENSFSAQSEPEFSEEVSICTESEEEPQTEPSDEPEASIPLDAATVPDTIEETTEHPSEATESVTETIAVETTATTATTATEKEPKEHGLIIGDYHEPEAYNCGTPGHHCAGPETHALLIEIADKGCDYCGSHTCPSFYATDEWGQGCYDPTKCPEYNVQHDPCYYCQDCGKPCGDGLGGTCAVYIIDIACPNCGEHVKAWTCHSCK